MKKPMLIERTHQEEQQFLREWENQPKSEMDGMTERLLAEKNAMREKMETKMEARIASLASRMETNQGVLIDVMRAGQEMMVAKLDSQLAVVSSAVHFSDCFPKQN
jgi:hypothetical protein